MEPVLFYEHEFYPFSNFSSFKIFWNGFDFMTSEHAYHCEKFPAYPAIQYQIKNARSAHGAFKLAQEYKEKRRADWDEVKIGIMKKILHAKVTQHPYVQKKLIDSGNRELIEDSWRDDFWGWGPNKDGKNQLGKLWMEVRYEVLYPSFVTFALLAIGDEHFECWISDHNHSGIGLRITEKPADIFEGQSNVIKIVVVAEKKEGGEYKVWSIHKNGNTLYKEKGRDDEGFASKVDVPISSIIENCTHLHYTFFSLFD